MKALKDIKVSKNPIPLQNALWLRPTGGLSFKLYYPQGDSWKEVTINSTDEEFKQEMEEELNKVKEQLNDVLNEVEGYEEKFSDIQAVEECLQTSINSINKTFEILLDSLEMNEITIPAKYSDIPSGIVIGVFQQDLDAWGLTEAVIKMILAGKIVSVNLTPTESDLHPTAYSVQAVNVRTNSFSFRLRGITQMWDVKIDIQGVIEVISSPSSLPAKRTTYNVVKQATFIPTPPHSDEITMP